MAGHILIPARGCKYATAQSLYTTAFPTVENPLSEGGIWVNTDSNSTLPQVSASGKCHGTQTGTTAPPYNDSQAWINSDYPDNQEVELTAGRAGGLDGTNREIECLLWMSNVTQFSTSFGNCQTDGFEINWQHNGSYLIVGRFKRAEIDRVSSPPAASTGDRFRTRIVAVRTAGVITSCQFQVWINDVAQTFQTSGTTTATYNGDAADPTGNKFPLGRRNGNGFWKDSAANNNEFWTSKTILRSV